jgi:MATE family multidrug resistance protein
MPLIISGLIETSTGFFSVMFSAHLGQVTLAATALVSTLFSTLMVFMWGVFSGISALVSNYSSTRDNLAAVQVTKDGLLIALLASIPTILFIWNIAPLLTYFGEPKAIVELARPYLHGLVWGVLPDFCGLVLLQFILGLGNTRMVMVFNIIWVPLTIVIIYGLMFGKWYLPKLGVAGIGWGSSLAMWIAVIILCFGLYFTPQYRQFRSLMIINRHKYYLYQILALGVPIGLMYCIEISFFMAIALLMGYMSSQVLAAHQIAVQYFLVMMSVVFCIQNATTVRVSYLLGQGNIANANLVGYIAMLLATIFMLMVACIYWFFPENIISIDFVNTISRDQTVISLAKQFLIIAAVFQILEGICIAIFGALRGLQDTKFTMYTSLLTFWGIAFPLSYLLIIRYHWQPSWVWWSMVLSAACEAFILICRYKLIINKYRCNTLLLSKQHSQQSLVIAEN